MACRGSNRACRRNCTRAPRKSGLTSRTPRQQLPRPPRRRQRSRNRNKQPNRKARPSSRPQPARLLLLRRSLPALPPRPHQSRMPRLRRRSTPPRRRQLPSRRKSPASAPQRRLLPTNRPRNRRLRLDRRSRRNSRNNQQRHSRRQCRAAPSRAKLRLELTLASLEAHGSLMSFTIAIIGRPNVGKSTLFNRLVGQKLALVDDEPGVTRDRREGEGRLGDLEFTIVDTAGLDQGAKGSLTARMQEQTEAAISLADALMFVIDARAGLTPNDRAFADFARRANRPVILVANKSEGKQGDAGAMESYALGLGEPIQSSAEHGEGLSDLYDALRALMPEPVDEPEEFDDDEVIEPEEEIAKRPIRVAIVGRPNAGKSTLINHLLGEERLLTSAEAGTTRDSISVEIVWQGREFRVFDTAGLRRRSRIEQKLEKLSVADALRAVRFVEVVVLMMDARNKFEEQDLRIADLIEREGRALVIAVNKWDLMGRQSNLISALRTEADHWLPQVRGVPIVAVSGLMGEGIERLMSAIEQAYAVWNKRIATAALNRWFEQAVDANPPPAVSGRRPELNYNTPAHGRPPSFILFCSRADAVPQSYLRYLVNSLRQYFELPGTPVRIALREKANPFAHKRKRPS